MKKKAEKPKVSLKGSTLSISATPSQSAPQEGAETKKPAERCEHQKQSKREWKAIMHSEVFWQLDGESDLHAVTIPHPPHAPATTTVRITHSNSYGPFDEADIFVRVGDLHRPTAPDDLDSATDWLNAALIEELVYCDGEKILRSTQEPFEEETPWWGTYEAQLSLPAGRQRIEIKVVSRNPEVLKSVVLSDWEVNVQK